MTSFFFVSEAQKRAPTVELLKKNIYEYELVFSDLSFSNSTRLFYNLLQGEPHCAMKS